MTTSETNPMSGQAFIEHAKANAGIRLTAFIAWDSSDPDVILYIPFHNYEFLPCPFRKISKEKVKITRIGSTHQCYAANGTQGQCWDADIIVTEPDPTNQEAAFFASLLVSFSQAHLKQKERKPQAYYHRCSCDGRASLGDKEGAAGPIEFADNDRWCLNVEGGREPGVHYYLTYQDAYNSRAYFFSSAVNAKSVTGPYECSA